MNTLSTSWAETASTAVVERSNTVKVATWSLLGVTVAFVIMRQVFKAIVFRRAALDVIFIFLATLSAIGLFVTTLLLASNGLGALGIITTERITVMMKCYYTSELLYISSICFSKLSLLVLFYYVMAVQRIYRRFVLGLGAFIISWSVASLLAVAFQCRLPRPWEVMTLRCFNMPIFWITYCIIDMSTEASIFMLSVGLVAYLKLRISHKFAVVACLAPRGVVIAASLIRLVWLYPVTPHSNPTYRLWLPAILTQTHACLSICTACIPYMVPFFKSSDLSLRRSDLCRTGNGIGEGTAPASLWFRRHKKIKILNSWDSTAVASLQYDRVPQNMPYIPTPPPLSPITPPRLYTPPNLSAASDQYPVYQDLNTIILERVSPAPPQTASSFALSPTCASPVPLLWVNSFIPGRPAPTPPLKIHSPDAPTVTSQTPSPASVARTPRFSLYPQQTQPQSRYSPDLRLNAFGPIPTPPIRALKSQVDGNLRRSSMRIQESRAKDYDYQIHSSSAAQPPKIDTAPLSTAPSTTTTSPSLRYRPASIQDMASPMGAAIVDYFDTASPQTAPYVPLPAIPYLGKHRQRNQQVLSPSNTLRFQNTMLKIPQLARSPQDVLQDDLFLPRDSVKMIKSPRSKHVPAIRDTRRSPRIVARES